MGYKSSKKSIKMPAAKKTSSKGPSYKDQIKACILALKERSGSSLPALKKFLNASPSQYRFINAALRSGVASGFFIKNKGKYKLSAEAKKPPKKEEEEEEEGQEEEEEEEEEGQ